MRGEASPPPPSVACWQGISVSLPLLHFLSALSRPPDSSREAAATKTLDGGHAAPPPLNPVARSRMMWLGTAFGYEQEFSHADLAMKWRRGSLERNVVLLCRYLGMHKAREENIGLAQ